MWKSRSKLLFISGIWTIIYSYMLYPTPEDVVGIQAISLVFIVWPGFLFFQIVCYVLFKNYQNKKIYLGLILLKSALFLIQPLIVKHQLHPMIILFSILGVFLIDFHFMKIENKVNLNEINLSVQEKNIVINQLKTYWFLIGSVVLLFTSYFQLKEANYTTILLFSLFYIFLILKKEEPKGKFVSIQLIGLLAVYLLALLNAPELLKGILLIAVLMFIYQLKKRMLKYEKVSNSVDIK
ncbi:hypothetical protein [Amphibacillus jilinensis]|uniref:hypothetical protein n=1 Tax=Amphibacillus jilinensis TaxID=1216008 RepID=UPI0002E3CB9D|nr:hypothetical protein [Amphibacillus jilinensis]